MLNKDGQGVLFTTKNKSNILKFLQIKTHSSDCRRCCGNSPENQDIAKSERQNSSRLLNS